MDVARRAVPSWLAPFAVSEMTGFVARSLVPVREIEPPFGGIPLIVSFGPRFHVSGLGGVGGGTFRSFIAGLQESWVFTEFVGESAGMQLNLNPLGAFALLGRPMHELANRTVALEDVLGVEGARLGERLGAAASWDERFALFEAALRERLLRAKPASEAIAWAWRRLQSTGGRVRIAALSDTIGCSRKHLVAQFREQIGLPPKTVARLLRFERAEALLKRPHASAGDVALACGYYDQSHLNREFRELAGTTPGRVERR